MPLKPLDQHPVFDTGTKKSDKKSANPGTVARSLPNAGKTDVVPGITSALRQLSQSKPAPKPVQRLNVETKPSSGEGCSIKPAKMPSSKDSVKKKKERPPLSEDGVKELKAFHVHLRQQERQRAKKEAGNKVFSHNGEVKTKVPEGPREEDVVRHAQIPDPNDVKVEEEGSLPLPQKPRRSVVVISVKGVRFFLENEHKKIKMISNSEAEFYDFVDDAVESIEVPAFSFFKKSFVKQEVLFSPFIYRFLASKLLILGDDSKNFTAIQNLALQYLYMFPREFIQGNLIYYTFRMSNLSVCTPLASCVPFESGISVNLLKPIVKPTALSNRPFGYSFNEAWTIDASRGFHMDIWQTTDSRVIQNITWETDCPPDPSHRGYTQYFQFTPVNQFVILADCGRNICDAFSRYFKAVYPGGERQRRNRQFQLLQGFPEHVIATTAKCAKAKYDSSSKTLTVRTGRKFKLFQTGSTTFFEMIQSPFLTFFWYVLWLCFRLYMAWDVYKGAWNWITLKVYAPCYYLHDYMPFLKLVVQLPHVKRLLYTRYYEEEKTHLKILQGVGDYESKFKYELAKVETTPDGTQMCKPGRFYATGAHTALTDYVLPAFFKWVCSRHDFKVMRLIGGRIMTFRFLYCATQEATASDLLFKEAENLPVDHILLIYFSDDGYLACNVGGDVKIFETDFSSCDSTNGFAVFAAWYYLADQIGGGFQCTRLLDLCSRPTKVINPDSRRANAPLEYVEISPEDLTEYSGHPGTTFLNNLAELAAGSAIIDICVARDSCDLTPELIQEAAYNVGYKMTVIQRSSYMSSTFLKRAYSTSSGRSMLVYGAILRSWGSVEGNPEPRHFGLRTSIELKATDNRQLAEILIRQKVDGLVNEPPSPLLEAMRVRAGLQVSHRPYEISYEDLNARYGTETWEWSSLLCAIENLSLGDVITSPVLEKIFAMDYSTEPVYTFDKTIITSCGASAANDCL